MFYNIAYRIGKHILGAILGERFVMHLLLGLLERLVKSTKNSLDDKLLTVFKEELKKQGVEI